MIIENQSNWEIMKYILGIISGVFISTIGFLFTHRFNWRNYLTQEFRVLLKINYTLSTNNEKEITFNYEINCTNSDEMSINYIYFNIPNNIQGNIPPNPTLGEFTYGKKGKFYVVVEKIPFKHNLCSTYILKDKEILKAIENQDINYISFIINTSKYGDIESNEVNV